MSDLIETFRVFLGLLLIAAGILKLPDMDGFVDIVRKYRILPRELVHAASYTHVVAELAIGIALLFRLYVTLAALAAAALFLVSAVAVISVLVRRVPLKVCGCYGTMIQVPLTWWYAGLNLGLTVLALIVLIGTR